MDEWNTYPLISFVSFMRMAECGLYDLLCTNYASMEI